MLDKNRRIGIIGGGSSGLSTAYFLEKKGYKNVIVLEKNNRVGGKCFTIKYKNKTYELGAMMAVPSHVNILELMDEVGMERNGPVLYRGFFTPDGKKTQQIKKDEVEEFQKQFSKLPSILNKYDKILEPGLTNVHKDLCLPYREWCKKNNIPLIEKVCSPAFTAFGYGHLDEIPAAYVLKFLDWGTLTSFIEVTHLITFKEGFQELWERIASKINDIRLSSEVIKIERGNTIKVTTSLETLEFDDIILTCPLDESIDFMDVSKEERELFSKIEYTNFNVFAYGVEGLPKVSGYIPDHINKNKPGHVLVWYYRWQDMAYNDLITVYALGSSEVDERQCKKIVEEDLKELGAKIKRLHIHKKWRYFPHVNTETMADGFYDKLEGLQSVNNTYYAGEIMSFSSVEQCIAYSKDLINRFF